MLGVAFSPEGTCTPRANQISGVFASTWFWLLQYCEPREDPRGIYRRGKFGTLLLGEACLATDGRLSEISFCHSCCPVSGEHK